LGASTSGPTLGAAAVHVWSLQPMMMIMVMMVVVVVVVVVVVGVETAKSKADDDVSSIVSSLGPLGS
jgi:uncharacterized membrane protein